MKPLLTLLVVAMCSNIAVAKSMLYVSVSQEKRIALLDIDEETGKVSPAGSLDVDGAPGAMAVSPNGEVLYVALRSNGLVGSFQIDAETGKLTLLNTQDVQGSAAFVSTDRTGRFLFTAYYGDGRVAVHHIGEDGRIGEQVQSVETAKNAHCIIVDRSNRFAYVPHTGPEKIFQFRFDADTGRLTPLSAGPLDTTDPDHKWGPRHLWLHPTLPFAYASLETGSAIDGYHRDPDTGRLAPLTQDVGGRHQPIRSSTIPDDFTDNNSTADIELTPDGRYAYVSNRGHNSIAAFALNPQTGVIDKPLGQFPTEDTPRSFNIHPNGKHLYAAGQKSGTLASYHLGSNGHLTQFQTLPLGKGPAWVQVVTLKD